MRNLSVLLAALITMFSTAYAQKAGTYTCVVKTDVSSMSSIDLRNSAAIVYDENGNKMLGTGMNKHIIVEIAEVHGDFTAFMLIPVSKIGKDSGNVFTGCTVRVRMYKTPIAIEGDPFTGRVARGANKAGGEFMNIVYPTAQAN